MPRKAVYTAKAPDPYGKFSQGCILGSMLAISGQLGQLPDKTLVGAGTIYKDDIKAQIEQALKNIAAICNEAGTDMTNIVSYEVQFLDRATWERYPERATWASKDGVKAIDDGTGDIKAKEWRIITNAYAPNPTAPLSTKNAQFSESISPPVVATPKYPDITLSVAIDELDKLVPSYFSDPQPARTIFEVPRLPLYQKFPGALVQISALVFIGSSRH